MESGLLKAVEDLGAFRQMPILFIGHGNPMNAIEENGYSRNWAAMGQILPRPKAILCVSAHWETWGTAVTAVRRPRTIHDFGGFPEELYAVQYPAAGDMQLAGRIKKLVRSREISLNQDWGLDHGCWCVLKRMYPEADIPVVQFSLDYTQPAQEHYNLGRELSDLRREGVLILGSGNIVHNLREIVLVNGDFNKPFGFDWAVQAGNLLKKLILENRHAELTAYSALSDEVRMAIPSPEHFLPLLYVLAAKQPDDRVALFNDDILAGSLSMTSLLVGGA
ncbi:MAG: 4,5-DOPA dioxygenase extradiol [Anaerolineae bacterium]|nr:4,5-DOPA dioxygenase extradiol [Anaerolineae bacterium]